MPAYFSPPSPLEYLSNFVWRFYNEITPFLEEGDFEAAKVHIDDLVLRHWICDSRIPMENLGAVYGVYLCSIVELGGFSKMVENGKIKTANITLQMAKRSIAEIDLVLSENPEYESRRARN